MESPREYHYTTLRVQYPYTLETHSTTITCTCVCEQVGVLPYVHESLWVGVQRIIDLVLCIILLCICGGVCMCTCIRTCVCVC